MTVQRVTPEQVLAWRDQRYRRREDLRLRTPSQAADFVNDVGYCFVFSGQGLEMPTLWEAVCGESRLVPVHHHDPDLGRTWDWKDELPSQGLVYYGKWLRKKPMLIALKLLPFLYALSENTGDVLDYLVEYRDGRLTDEGRRVYEVLLKGGPMPTSHLRRAAGLAGKDAAPRFDRAIVELQMRLMIVKVGISDANAWRYCYVYDLFQRRFPDVAAQAEAISYERAGRVLLETYLKNVGVAEVADLARLFGKQEAAVNLPLKQLWAERDAWSAEVTVEGRDADCLASIDFVAAVRADSQ